MTPERAYAALFALAEEHRRRAYAPYSGFHVGAAIEAADGRCFGGCNIENGSFGATICAERTALFSAVAAGARQFVRLALVSDAHSPASPCGLCRQVLAEFGAGMALQSRGTAGETRSWTLDELLPDRFVGPRQDER